MEPADRREMVPSIPNFHCMSIESLKYHTSQARRDETAALRKQILPGKRATNGETTSAKSYGHSEEVMVLPQTSPCRSAPVGHYMRGSERFQCKHNHRNANFINRKPGSVPHNPSFGYLAKEVFKRPELDRPPYFVKVHTDTRPSFDYPSGVLSSPECFFTKVSSVNNNADLNSQIPQSKRNPNITGTNVVKKKHAVQINTTYTNQQTSNNNNCNQQVSRDCIRLPQPVTEDEQQEIKIYGKNALIRQHIHSELTANHVVLKHQSRGSNGVRPATSAQTVENGPSSRKQQPLTSPAKDSSNFTWNESEKRILLELRRKNRFKGIEVRNNRDCGAEDVTKVTPKMRSRNHFIDPEWPSEVVGWARYSHPANHDAFRHSWI